MEEAQARHLGMMDERNIDVQFISPRPVAMMHWEMPHIVDHWTKVTNDVIHQTCEMYPDRFVGVAQLPQVGIDYAQDTISCTAEFERAIGELGFVAATVNPDPGGDRRAPGMNDRYWFPLYRKAVELKAPLIVHASISRDPRITILPHSYQYNFMTEQALATQLLENSDVFDRFPDLRVLVCHCGGALSRFIPRAQSSGIAGGGQVGIGAQGAPAHEDEQKLWPNNLFFDTCAYDKDYLSTAMKHKGIDQMCFGSESPGSGYGSAEPRHGPTRGRYAAGHRFDRVPDGRGQAEVGARQRDASVSAVHGGLAWQTSESSATRQGGRKDRAKRRAARYTHSTYVRRVRCGRRRCAAPTPQPASKASTSPGRRRSPGFTPCLAGLMSQAGCRGRQVRDVPLLAQDVVRFAGEKVAVVAADDEETAQRAAGLIIVGYEEITPVLDALEAQRDGTRLIHPDMAAYEGFRHPPERPVQHLLQCEFRAWRHRRGVCRGRPRLRRRVSLRQNAPGISRAALLRGLGWRRRARSRVGFEQDAFWLEAVVSSRGGRR